MQIKQKLQELKLTPINSIVIGSGILNVLDIRESNDIDVVVSEDKYNEFLNHDRFQQDGTHESKVLKDKDDVFEIGTMWKWHATGKILKLEDLFDHSVIIDGVRYNTVEFLLEAKKQWIKDGDQNPKTFKDIELMEKYLSNS